jgi:hypothetical protein
MNQTSSNPAQDELIRIRAYEIWCGKGCPNGSAEQDWVEAERAIATLLAAEAAQSAEAGSGKATGAEQKAPEAAARPAKRPNRANASGPLGAPATALHPERTRAVASAPVDTKPLQATPRATAGLKPDQKAQFTAERRPSSVVHKPAPPIAFTVEPTAPGTENGRAKGGTAKAHGRGHAAAATTDEAPGAPPVARQAASGSSTPADAGQAAGTPTNGKRARGGRTGGRRAAGPRQRRG